MSANINAERRPVYNPVLGNFGSLQLGTTKPKLLTFRGRPNGRIRGAGISITTPPFRNVRQIGMEGNTQFPVVEELAVLVERAERACRTTAQLVRDFNFIVVWYQSRPRWKLRADPILDESDS